MKFEKEFSTEEQCREYLFKLRWPNGFICPKCGHNKAWQTGEMEYKCQGCGRKTTAIAGTIFQGTHKPLTLWFRAIWYVTSQKNGASAQGLQKILGLGSYHTAWGWLHKLILLSHQKTNIFAGLFPARCVVVNRNTPSIPHSSAL